jgi:hypothetical protein
MLFECKRFRRIKVSVKPVQRLADFQGSALVLFQEKEGDEVIQ